MNKSFFAPIAVAMASCMSLATAHAQEGATAADDNHIALGAGVVLQDGPFRGSSSEAFPLPIISIKQGAFYFEGAEAGVRLDSAVGAITPSVDLFLAARGTSGRDRQKVTADAGLRASIGSEFGTLSGEIRHDITGKFDGTEVIARYSIPITAGRFTFVPALHVSWLDRKTADYMYGITAKQRERMIEKNRDVILPVAPITDDAVNVGSDLSINIRLSDKVVLLGVFSSTYLDKSIRKSPAIDKKCESQAVLGITYQF